MKAILRQYRQFYGIPPDISDGIVLFHLVVLTIFFFALGFMVSQIIIFLIGR
ncbi:MAG TPA: hypothetical protein VGC95_10510 [Chitinophagaceae bacterium]